MRVLVLAVGPDGKTPPTYGPLPSSSPCFSPRPPSQSLDEWTGMDVILKLESAHFTLLRPKQQCVTQPVDAILGDPRHMSTAVPCPRTCSSDASRRFIRRRQRALPSSFAVQRGRHDCARGRAADVYCSTLLRALPCSRSCSCCRSSVFRSSAGSRSARSSSSSGGGTSTTSSSSSSSSRCSSA